jgi:hypothetical protein
VVKNQQRSPYREWFKILSWNDSKKGKGFNYSGWWAVKELPELNQDEDGIVAGPREYIFAATRGWSISTMTIATTICFSAKLFLRYLRTSWRGWISRCAARPDAGCTKPKNECRI